MNLPKIWESQRWEIRFGNIFVRPKSLGGLSFWFLGSKREPFRGILSMNLLLERGIYAASPFYAATTSDIEAA